MDMTIRPRRLRGNDTLRRMVRETRMDKSSLIYPMFVKEGSGIIEEIPSMDGQYRYSVDCMGFELERLLNAGVKNVMFFGIPDQKDEVGSGAYNENGIVQRALREAKEKYPGTQFVILSGYAEFEYAETAIELGVKSYLLKPISNDELKRVMRKLFETLEKERQMEVEIFRKHQLETEQKGWLQEKAVNHLWQDNAAFLTEEEAAQLKSTCPELWKKEKGSLYLVVINIDAKSYEGKKISA